MEANIIRKWFAEQLVEIETARITNTPFDFVEFINEEDILCGIAMAHGDIVPSLYVEMLDRVVGEMEPCRIGDYSRLYKQAVDIYLQEMKASCDPGCPDYLGRMAENAFFGVS
ncbi:hypothetical protein [Alteromonas macleodii]|uniref:hypothetical protein n=1 Tax=Pseudoalteromonas lipolytica TaxID=570156 RepID=UPI0027378EA9|nr:hypothetical protein [Alteromonas macleodii]